MNDPFKSPSKPHAHVARVPTAELFPVDAPSAQREITLNYDFNGAAVRVVGTWDEPWFVAADVCAALGIENVSLAVNGRPGRPGSGLDDDEKGIAIGNTLGGAQEMIIISEPGLYSLIMSSRKPNAKKFQRWVTHEVLPSIRKTGGYIHDRDLFMTHRLYRDIRAECLEITTKTFRQLHKHHYVPHMRKKFMHVSPEIVDAFLSEDLRFMSNYYPDDDGNLQYLPVSQRKAQPSKSVIQDLDEEAGNDMYDRVFKHVTNPTMTREQYLAKVCTRPVPGLKPVMESV